MSAYNLSADTPRYAPTIDADADERPDAPLCGACNGSGEGMRDGTRCDRCHGRGVLLPKREREV